MLRLLGRFEGRALLFILAAVAAVWAFLDIGSEVSEGDTLAFDRRLLLAMRTAADPNDPIGSRNFEEAMRDITALGGFTVLALVTVVGVLVFYFHGKHRHALVLAGTVILAQAFSEGLKHLYGRPRPDLVPHAAYVYSASFPSGHSMLSAATYLTLAMLLASVETRQATKTLIFVLALALMTAVGISRVYLGVHWPSDVLAGWFAGAAFAFLGWVALRGLKRRPAGGGETR